MNERLLRLRAAAVSGNVPPDLLPWLLELAAATEGPALEKSSATPAQLLAIRLSDQIDRWMTLRGATARSISVPRRTLARCLKGENVTLETIAEVADALGCDAFIEFLPRPGVYGTTSAISGTKPFHQPASPSKMDAR